MRTIQTVLLAALLASAFAHGDEPVRVAALAAQSSSTGAGGSLAPAFSADGQFVVFVSQAHNLVTNDTPAVNLAVFIRDLARRQTSLVSVDTSGSGGPDADANQAAISSNGQCVAFASAAGNLVPNDTNRASDVFVRDTVAGTTTLASADTNGLAPTVRAEGSTHPLLSADRRWVFFDSLARSLATNADSAVTRDVFARDLQAGVTRLVSVNRSGTAGLNPGEDSTLLAVTPDGRFAAFASKAPDLVVGTAPGRNELFVRDLATETTTWASSNVVSLAGFGATYTVLSAVLSADGCWVVFKAAAASTAIPASVFRHDLVTGMTEQLTAFSRSDSWPDMSADGRFIAFEAGDSNALASDVFVRDTVAGTNLLIGAGSAPAPLSGLSHTPVLTPDGRAVAFLREEPTPGFTAKIYVCDLIGGTTRVASVTTDGVEASVPATSVPALSADGQSVAFDSDGSGWVSNDLNRASDVFIRDVAAGTTELVSERHPQRPELTAAGLSVATTDCLSSDGRWLALLSYDSNLVQDDTNGWPDIFIRDLATGSILVPVGARPGQSNPATLWQTNAVSPPLLSRDGNHLAYVLVNTVGAGNSYRIGPWMGSIVWHDLQTKAVLPATITAAGTEFTGMALNPALSLDGQLVAFESASMTLVNGLNTTTASQVFVRDMAGQVTYLVSTNRDRNTSSYVSYGNDASTVPAFSPDGHWLLFQSRASNLTTNYLASANNELFGSECGWASTNRQFSHARMISRTATAALGCTGLVAFSTNSRFAAFASVLNTNPSLGQGVYVHDLQTRETTLVASNATTPALSGDGRWVAFQTWLPSATNSFTNQIMVWDRNSGALELISVDHAGAGIGNGSSSSPLISANGRYVVFSSSARNLVANDTNGRPDIFVRDRWASNTVAVTLSLRTGYTGGGFTRQPMLGADGRTVIFNSFASDLVAGDYNNRRDVFVLRLGSLDSDGDGLDDDWEMAYFNTLARDGTGDFDGDGATDGQEFRAGTDPTNCGSILRAMTLVELGSRRTTVLWAAAPGKTYQVQYKNELADAEWQTLPGTVEVNGATASLVDEAAPGQGRRFYRVAVVP